MCAATRGKLLGHRGDTETRLASAPKHRLWHNVISFLGLTISAIATLLLITFALFSLLTPWHNPYVDVVGYLVLPGLFLLGLVIVPVGMWIHYRALTRGGVLSRWLVGIKFDLGNPTHRRAGALFLALNLFVILPVIGVSSYQGYRYSESTEFCANVCHAVMEPQAVTHAISPHSRVACAECHIGEGAGWFVKSKLSGLGQVVAVLRDSYSRPIPPAITDLRPARDTCEECHWPAKFFGSQLKEIAHFSSDKANTPRTVRMLLRTGGADESIGRVEGIHMHMALSGPIDYIATDPQLQKIPWVRYTKGNGKVTIYRSDATPATESAPEGVLRRVDCMDCHNRGAHHFRAPDEIVDMYLNAGLIDRTLPFIKREMVKALVEIESDAAQGESLIAGHLRSFYSAEYSDIWELKQQIVEQAVGRAQEIYRRSFFPHMNLNWRSYPDNIGHLRSSGCFRCHDGQHIDASGQALPSACDVCHTFLNPVEGVADAFVEGPFRHSMSLYLHENLRCDQCHTGGALPTCRDCHGSGEWLENYGKDFFEWNKKRE